MSYQKYYYSRIVDTTNFDTWPYISRYLEYPPIYLGTLSTHMVSEHDTTTCLNYPHNQLTRGKTPFSDVEYMNVLMFMTTQVSNYLKFHISRFHEI